MQLKKELDPDREAGGTFISFLGKLVKKRKGYITISNLEEVDHSDRIFKVNHNAASILTNNPKEESSTSSILEDLDKPEKLEHITRMIQIYNLRSHSISPTISRKKLAVPKLRK